MEVLGVVVVVVVVVVAAEVPPWSGGSGEVEAAPRSSSMGSGEEELEGPRVKPYRRLSAVRRVRG